MQLNLKPANNIKFFSMKTLLKIATGAVFSILTMTACLREIPSPGTPDDRIVVLIESAPLSLDPRFTVDAQSAKISRLIFSNLVSVDNETITPKPHLAEKIFPDPENPNRYIVLLKKGIRFHDGTELTARDVVYTFNSILDPKLHSPYRGFYQKKIRSVTAVKGDPYRVVITLYQPYATFVTDLVMGIVPAHILEGREDGRFPADQYIGSGPFTFLYKDGNRKIALRRFDAYFQTPALMKYIVFKIITDENTRLLGLLGGSADLTQNTLSPILVDVLEQHKNLKVYHVPSISYTYILLNLRDSELSKLAVRQAISYAINREHIIQGKFKNMAIISTGMLAPMHWAYNGNVKTYPYDPETAKRLLDPIVKQSPDKRLTFVIKTSTDRFRRIIVKEIAMDLAKIGIDLEIISLEKNTFIHDVQTGNFQLALLQLPEVVEPDLYHWMLYSLNVPNHLPQPGDSPFSPFDRRYFNPELLSQIHAGDDGAAWVRSRLLEGLNRMFFDLWGLPVENAGSNRTYYFNPEVDRLLDEGRYTMDTGKRKAIYSRIQEILASELPVISLWHEDNIAVMGADVEDYRMLPLSKFTSLEKVRKLKD